MDGKFYYKIIKYFNDIYEGGIFERVNIKFCHMCGRNMRKEDDVK